MPPLIAALLDSDAYPHPAQHPRLIETHASWVILAGDYAYKLKKPVNLGFLDFSTLEKREFYCREEIRLNRRLAPDTYLGVVAIAGTPPRVAGAGPVLEWAVQMRAFPAEATLDRATQISAEQVDAIADRVARFHGDLAAAPSDFGSAAAVRAPVAENFRQLRTLLRTQLRTQFPNDALLHKLEAWSEAEGERLADHFAARKQGFIRECHGDLHLGNIAWVDAAPLIFDGIEFDPGLRWIDVISEIAFLCMDLAHRGMARGQVNLAWRLLNRYLEHSGDYAGLRALPYYLVYRALVRAKVSAIRAAQANDDFTECRGYLELAEKFTRPTTPSLLLMHGVSGSGKTWMSQHLLEHAPTFLPTLRLRSDVERKRLFGLCALADSRKAKLDIYSREAGERTRARLLELAGGLLDDGFSVIVDATFIRRDWRFPFEALAATRSLPWRIAAMQAAREMLRQRLDARQAGGLDASEAGSEVLAAQLAAIEPFTPEELAHVVDLDTDPERALNQLRDCHDLHHPA